MTFKEGSRREDDEVRRKRRSKMKGLGLQKSQQGLSFFPCHFNGCLRQPILQGKATTAEREVVGKRQEISALWI